MTRKSAAAIASDLREILQDKIITIEANGKRFSADKLERYDRHMSSLRDAIEGFDNLARAQAERQAQRQEEVAS